MEPLKKEYSLQYQFDFPNINDLKPGDVLTSNCSPVGSPYVTSCSTSITATTSSNNITAGTEIPNVSTKSALFNSGIILSPAGFPLEFSLQLLYHKCDTKPFDTENGYYQPLIWHAVKKHYLSLQLRLHQSNHASFLPPLLIQPTLVPKDDDDPHRPSWLNKRHVGPQQGASWRFVLETADRPDLAIPLHFSGQFRFHLLNEPQHLIDNLPPRSEATWSCLPNDMISAVLRELPMAERVRARLVCRHWARILDTDALAWNNISHLAIYDGMRNDINDYDGGWLNVVRLQLLPALRFLLTRKAPIRCLEIRGVAYNQYKHLILVLSNVRISLKAISIYHSLPETHVTKLFNAQRNIERLDLGKSMTRALFSNPSQFQVLSQLRILGLFWLLDLPDMNAFISLVPLFPRLQGLRLCFDKLTWPEAEVSEELEKRVPNLRRVQAVEWEGGGKSDEVGGGIYNTTILSPCSCRVTNFRLIRHVVFGSEHLSPSAAAYLLIPVHVWHDQFVSHHVI